jgi:hypothetical protein
MTRRTTALAAAVLMLGPLAACSGDESDSSGEAASSETPSASAGTPAPGDTESAEETRTDSGADPDAELTAADKAYCDEVATARKALSGAGGAVAVASAVEALQDVSRLAPADVRPEWQSLADTAAKVQATVSKAGLKIEDLEDPASLGNLTSKQQRILTEGLQGLDVTRLQQDSAVISEQVGELCGIALTPDGGNAP